MAARQRTGQQAHVHWLVPFLMIGGLVCGIALSLGHHFLYNSWDGQIVQSKDQQEWVLRIGTGLAFLIKVFLTSAAGFAYTQFLWHTLKSREVSIEGIDAMFAATNNAGSFFTLELWRKGFPLVLLAGIVWFLPVVAIFPPATLTVQPFVNLSIYDNKPLLTINYSTATPFARLDNLIKEYIAPSNEISRIVSAVSSRGSFLSIPPPRDDYSFNLTFDGPSLSCGPMGGNKSFHDAFDRIFRNKTEYQGIAAEKTAYVGIAPGSSSTSEDGVLYGLKSALGSGVSTYGSKGTGILFSFPMFGEDPARQDAAKHTIACEMFLASHQVNVAFKSGEQFVQVIQITRLPNDTASPELKVVHIAAIAILDALGGILEGKISTSDDGFISIMRTRILSTVFMLTNEMTAAQRTYFGGIDAHPENVTPGNNLSFKDAMEQLVFNVTLSLFACPGLLMDPRNSTRGNIMRWTRQNQYAYNPRNLYIAYGVGVAFATFVVLIGVLCISISSNAYSRSFSTILRTTRNQQLDDLVREEATDGAEPLPKYLESKRLKFTCRTRSDGGESTCIVGSFAVKSAPEMRHHHAISGPLGNET